MVGLKKSADKVSWSLVGFVNRNSLLYQLKWVHHECDSVQKSLFMSPRTILILHIGIEGLLVRTWNYIPSFYSSFVIIVERINPEVFHMPAEAGEEASHVDPRMGDPTYFLLTFLAH